MRQVLTDYFAWGIGYMGQYHETEDDVPGGLGLPRWSWDGLVGPERALDECFAWHGREVRWQRFGAGPAVVFCHGTPWSSELWRPFAEALAGSHTVHLWDMPGYGRSSKHPDHRVSLDVQGELFADLLAHWGVASRTSSLTTTAGRCRCGPACCRVRRTRPLPWWSGCSAPWGSDYFSLVRDHADVFSALPPAVHEGALRAYVAGASHVGLTESAMQSLVEAVAGRRGAAAFYGQIAQADERYTGGLRTLLPRLTCRSWSCGVATTRGSRRTAPTGWPGSSRAAGFG